MDTTLIALLPKALGVLLVALFYGPLPSICSGPVNSGGASKCRQSGIAYCAGADQSLYVGRYWIWLSGGFMGSSGKGILRVCRYVCDFYCAGVGQLADVKKFIKSVEIVWLCKNEARSLLLQWLPAWVGVVALLGLLLLNS